MPPTGILFAAYVYCQGLWKSTQLSGAAAAGSQGYLKLLQTALIAWFRFQHIAGGRLPPQKAMGASVVCVSSVCVGVLERPEYLK